VQHIPLSFVNGKRLSWLASGRRSEISAKGTRQRV